MNIMSNDNKFCYIYGSFVTTVPNLRRPDSDIDLLCSPGIDKCVVKAMIIKKYPNLPKKIPINITPIIPQNNTLIYNVCYWQSGNIMELFNVNNIKYIMKPNYLHDFSSYLRDPDKNKFKQYMKDNYQFVFTKYNYNNCINRHYGKENYDSIINNFPDAERILFNNLYKNRWKYNKKCGDTIVINTKNKTVNTAYFQTTYDEFTKICLQKVDI